MNILRHLKNLVTVPHYTTHLRWRFINGDKTHRLNYPLNENALVIDVGGYKGEWSAQIHQKYAPSIFIFEPIKEFSDICKQRFENTPRVKVYEFGLGVEKTSVEISLSNDASSSFKAGEKSTAVSIEDIITFIDENDLQNIDLIKLNIEGGEFDILDKLLETGYIKRFKHLQIQFHDFVDDAAPRRRDIVRKLKASHARDWNYPFVWEGWSLKNG